MDGGDPQALGAALQEVLDSTRKSRKAEHSCHLVIIIRIRRGGGAAQAHFLDEAKLLLCPLGQQDLEAALFGAGADEVEVLLALDRLLHELFEEGLVFGAGHGLADAEDPLCIFVEVDALHRFFIGKCTDAVKQVGKQLPVLGDEDMILSGESENSHNTALSVMNHTIFPGRICRGSKNGFSLLLYRKNRAVVKRFCRRIPKKQENFVNWFADSTNPPGQPGGMGSGSAFRNEVLQIERRV